MKNEPILDQKQQKSTKEQQTSLMEQRYYILQDLDNVLGIFAETAEIIKFFEEFPDHQMVTNAQNRLITQINLSNTIHFDQKNVDDPLLVGNLKDLKSLAKEYFEEIRQSIPFTDKIDHVADHYVKQNLNENNILQQLPGVQSNSKANFTPETIQNVFVAMNQVDTIMGKIRAGQNVDIPSKEEFKQKMKIRQLNAQKKLKQNFQREYEESQKLKQKKGNNINEQFHQRNNNGNSKNNQSDNQEFTEQQQSKKRKPIDYNSSNNSKKVKCIEKNQNDTLEHAKISIREHDQQIEFPCIINEQVIKYLKQLETEIQQKTKMDDSKLTTIVKEMKTKIDVQILIRIFQDLSNQFENSEISKLFDIIKNDLSQTQSSINSSGIIKIQIVNEQLKQLNEYIKKLEKQQICR